MKVTLIGAGPGDPELMTRKAWRLLGQADVVLHDALMDVAGMQEAAPKALWLDVGKRMGVPSAEQTFICRSLVSYAKQGLNVVRLKGGDPTIFGRSAEEITACRDQGIEIEIVPGVTAACAAAADLQASLTLRGISRSLTFVTPRVGRRELPDSNNWLQASLAAETVAMYMAGTHAQEICKQLISAGKSSETTICIVENASRTGLRLKSSLGEIARDGLLRCEGPVTLLIGEALNEVSLVKQTSKNQSETGYRCDHREFALR
jgi:uroporphyrin-III C-methyltransferase